MAKREWTVLADPETGVLDREEVAQTLVDIEAAGHLLGGVFKIAPARRRVGAEYVTVGWLFQWDSLAPAVGAVEPEPEGTPEPVPDFVEPLPDEAPLADMTVEEPVAS